MEIFEHDGTRYALILRSPKPSSDVEFFTPDDAPLQFGAFDLPRGHQIQPHVHLVHERTLRTTTEVLVIQAGKLLVEFFDAHRKPIGERTVGAGDVIVLLQGAHGFRVLEPLKMLEIKQGPYAGDLDKMRFNPTPIGE